MTKEEYISNINQVWEEIKKADNDYHEYHKKYIEWGSIARTSSDGDEIYKAKERERIYKYLEEDARKRRERAGSQGRSLSNAFYNELGYGYAPWNDTHLYTPDEMKALENYPTEGGSANIIITKQGDTYSFSGECRASNGTLVSTEQGSGYKSVEDTKSAAERWVKQVNLDNPTINYDVRDNGETKDETKKDESQSSDNQIDTSTNGSSSSSDTNTPTDAVSGATSSGNVNTNADRGAGDTITQNDIVQDSKENVGFGAGLDNNTIMNKGTVYPIIRINDHYCSQEEIHEFYVESGYFKDYKDYHAFHHPVSGFVPTFHLVLYTTSPDLLKNNQVKSGDICAVFFSSGGGLIKSMRIDFIINTVFTDDKQTEITDTPQLFIIDGEMNIPKLRNESERFNFNGSSRDAMVDASKRLGLSFFFCDPDDTQDLQVWVCGNNLHDYILDVSSRSWKDFNSFFDCWIDPRYGLSFINMNKMLIADGLDEMIDLTPFVNMVNRSSGVDGKHAVKTEKRKQKEAIPQGKIITNIPGDEESITPFYAKKWSIVNRASEIAKEIGVNVSQMYDINNGGIDSENTDLEMNYSIPINQTKLRQGFFVLIGPGVNLTYTQADQKDPTQSFVKNSMKVMGGNMMETMSDGDSAQIEQNGNNMFSSGNTNKFYDAGYEHNMRNNLQLQKQYTDVELLGCNLAIMRGEKIPMIIIDNDKVQSTARVNNYTSSTLQNALYEMVCGWYIIDGIMWKWSRQNQESSPTTLWSTHLKLVRREWPVPGKVTILTKTDENVIQQTEVDVSNTAAGLTQSNLNTEETENADNTAVGTDASTALTVDTQDTTSNSEVPLTGLKDELKIVYQTLKSMCPNIKIVSARRWAVDENGKRIEGNAYVMKNGLYKCVNAKGEIMYFQSPNSRHLYGEAFDIINASGQDFNQIMTNYVLDNNVLLQIMAQSGVAACVEQTIDDSGQKSSHYHFGTDVEIQEKFWNSVKAYNNHIDALLMNAINSHNTANKRIQSAEIKHDVVQEG